MGDEKIEKLKKLLELLNDPEIQNSNLQKEVKKSIEEKFGITISGNNNLLSIYGNAIQKQINKIYIGKKEAKDNIELEPSQLKELQEWVKRIVNLELQAKKYRIASPMGIRINGKTEKEKIKSAFTNVWKRFNDEYNIHTYKVLPVRSFNHAIKFLMGWEQKLLNAFIRRNLFEEIEYDKNYLLKRMYGVANNNGKSKEDLEMYCLRKFGITLGEAKPLHIWYVYSRFAVKRKKAK